MTRSILGTTVLTLIAVGSILVTSSRAQVGSDFLARLDGTYSGRIDRTVAASLGPQRPASKEEAAELEKEERFEWTMRNSEMAFRTHQKDQPVSLRLVVSPAGDDWTIELRHSIKQYGSPLPSLLTVSIPKSLAALSPVKVEGLHPGNWEARATHTSEALIVYFTELDTLLPPIHYQISLQSVGTDLDFVLWRLDFNGRRASAWTGKLSRE